MKVVALPCLRKPNMQGVLDSPDPVAFEPELAKKGGEGEASAALSFGREPDPVSLEMEQAEQRAKRPRREGAATHMPGERCWGREAPPLMGHEG